MRNPGIEAMDLLVGEWAISLSDCWFLEPDDPRGRGAAHGRWLGEGFIELTAELAGEPTWQFLFGRNDARDELVALYHDPRPTSRVFRVTWGDGEWTMVREDPDFHQRFLASVAPDRIDCRVEASDDQGATWRKDFDLTFERLPDTDGPAEPPSSSSSPSSSEAG